MLSIWAFATNQNNRPIICWLYFCAIFWFWSLWKQTFAQTMARLTYLASVKQLAYRLLFLKMFYVNFLANVLLILMENALFWNMIFMKYFVLSLSLFQNILLHYQQLEIQTLSPRWCETKCVMVMRLFVDAIYKYNRFKHTILCQSVLEFWNELI